MFRTDPFNGSDGSRSELMKSKLCQCLGPTPSIHFKLCQCLGPTPSRPLQDRPLHYANRLRSGLTLLQPNASSWTQSYSYDAANRLSGLGSPAGSFAYNYSPGVGGITSSSSLIQKLSMPN